MLSYARLLEANNAIQTLGDDTYWLCVTRTVQESKLFPVPSYMLLYVQLMRKAASAGLPSTKAILFNILQSPQMALPS